MKTFKERFELNYAAVLVEKDGKEKIEYVYYAPWYFWDSPTNNLSRDKTKVLLSTIVGIIVFLIVSTRRGEVNALAWVDILVALSVGARIFELMAAIRWKFAKPKVTQPFYKEINGILRIVPLLDACFMLAAAFLGFFFTKRIVAAEMTILVSCGYLLCAVLSFSIRWFYVKLTFHTEKNQALKEHEGNY